MGPSRILWFRSSLSTIFGSIKYKTIFLTSGSSLRENQLNSLKWGKWKYSPHQQLFELLKCHFALIFKVSLFDHVPNVIVRNLCVAHFGEGFLQTIESDDLLAVSFEDGEAFEDMFFTCDGEHHPKWVREYLAMSARNSPASIVPLLSASHSLISFYISSGEYPQSISLMSWVTSCIVKWILRGIVFHLRLYRVDWKPGGYVSSVPR